MENDQPVRLEVFLNLGMTGCQSLPGRTRGIGDAGQRKKVCNGNFRAGPWLVSGGVGGQSWCGGEEAEELRGLGEGRTITWMSGSPEWWQRLDWREENNPGLSEQSVQDGQEVCNGRDKKERTGSTM